MTYSHTLIIVTGSSGFLASALIDKLTTSFNHIFPFDIKSGQHSLSEFTHLGSLESSENINAFVKSLSLHGSPRVLIFHLASLNPIAAGSDSCQSASYALNTALDMIPSAIDTEVNGIIRLLISLFDYHPACIDIVWANSIYSFFSPPPELYQSVSLPPKPFHYPVVKSASLALASYLSSYPFDVSVNVHSVVIGGIISGRESQQFINAYRKFYSVDMLSPRTVVDYMYSLVSCDRVDSSVYGIGVPSERFKTSYFRFNSG